MCISKRIKWIKKKSHREKKIFCIFFQSPHQVDMKNVVECPREFIAYFNALETTCVPLGGVGPSDMIDIGLNNESICNSATS